MHHGKIRRPADSHPTQWSGMVDTSIRETSRTPPQSASITCTPFAHWSLETRISSKSFTKRRSPRPVQLTVVPTHARILRSTECNLQLLPTPCKPMQGGKRGGEVGDVQKDCCALPHNGLSWEGASYMIVQSGVYSTSYMRLVCAVLRNLMLIQRSSFYS